MVKYSCEVTENVEKTVCARGNQLKASFKNTHQTGAAIRGKQLLEAKAYLQAVLEKKRCIPFTRYNTGVGRTAQAKEFKLSQGRWPTKSVKLFLDLIQNLESNAKAKGLNADDLILSHVAVQRAICRRRRTFRAHGRISPYMSHPCHVEIICKPKVVAVPRASDETHQDVKLSRAANKVRRLKIAH